MASEFGDDLAFRQAQRRNLAAGIEAEETRFFLLALLQRDQLEFIRRARFGQRRLGGKSARSQIAVQPVAHFDSSPAGRKTSALPQKKKPASEACGLCVLRMTRRSLVLAAFAVSRMSTGHGATAPTAH